MTAATTATGSVEKAFGNLLEVRFEGDIRQGEVAMVDLEGVMLKSEVIEITGDIAKIQVYEDTRGIKLGTQVKFTGDLLEAELGPGLLSSIYDGLQNPLEEVAENSGYYLPRGVYLPPIDRTKHWDFEPAAKEGDVLKRGDTLGTTHEGRFHHHIMIPFHRYDNYTITWMIGPGSYNVDTIVAKAKDSQGREHQFTMVQKWPVKKGLSAGVKIKPSEMMATGLRIIDTQFPVMKGGTFCTPGPFGAGKTVLQHHLSKYSDVDIVVVCRVWRARRRSGGNSTRVSPSHRSAHSRNAHDAYHHHLQYLLHARCRPRILHLHGRDHCRVLSSDGLGRALAR